MFVPYILKSFTNMKNVSKIRLKESAIFVLLFVCFFITSCNDEDQEWRSDIRELKVELEDDVAMQNAPFIFTDLSLGVKSRIWEFEDGDPATSNDPVVSVRFTKPGKKKWTLNLVYDNGTTESQTMELEVKEPLVAVINIEKLTPLGCLPLDEDIQFSLEIEGSYSSIEWKFENGNPSTSTETNPIIRFAKEGPVKASVKIYRETDGASVRLNKDLYIGNYPMLVAYTKADMDSWNFDAGKSIGKWTVWNGSAGVDEVGNGKAVRVSGGANGSANCLEIKYNKANEHWQFFTRDNWINNAQLEKGKKYEFKFWMKADTNFLLKQVFVMNNLPEWSWNELLGAHAGNNWVDYFPEIPFEVQNETVLLYAENIPITTSWKEFKYEFTVGDKDLIGVSLPNRLLNVFPSFAIESDQPRSIYIDGIMINLIEE